mmetsp:Transcript_19776/g.58201  ORF Transcript_19776/g.58201 Transcript_19776/m.58201 type:complete len:218 (-) Transcript_19776:71-724(-)
MDLDAPRWLQLKRPPSPGSPPPTILPMPRRAHTANSSEPRQRRAAPLHRDAPRHHRHHDVAADGRRPRHRAPALQRRRDRSLPRLPGAASSSSLGRSPRRTSSANAQARQMCARPPPPCSPTPPRRRFRRRPCARRRSLRRRRRPHFRRPRFAPRRRRRPPFSRRPRFPQSRARAARLRRRRPPSRRRSPHSLVQGCRRRRHSLGSPKRCHRHVSVG